MNDKISTCKKKSKECLPTTGMATTEILVSIEVQLDPANSNLVISNSLLFFNSRPFPVDLYQSFSIGYFSGMYSKTTVAYMSCGCLMPEPH